MLSTAREYTLHDDLRDNIKHCKAFEALGVLEEYQNMASIIISLFYFIYNTILRLHGLFELPNQLALFLQMLFNLLDSVLASVELQIY
jgi:hypothetical protein